MTPPGESRTAQPPPDQGLAGPVGWLVLVYRVPSEPSRLRATVWRRLKGHGAIYLQNSVAALPDSPAAERAMRGLRAEIGELGGTAQLLRSTVLVGAADISESYNSVRDDEYDEIVDKCGDFLAEIANETAAEHFTFAELEENDEDLTKLRRWLEKIAARDALLAPGAGAAQTALAACVRALEAFAGRVYDADADGS